MAGEIGKRLLELQSEYANYEEAVSLEQQHPGTVEAVRSVDDIAAEYETLILQLLRETQPPVHVPD